MSLESLFLLRCIDQEESPSVKRLLPTPTAGLLLTPRPAESALVGLSPASWCGHRPPDRIRRSPRNPDCWQSLRATFEFRPNPTKWFGREKLPFHSLPESPPTSRSTAF